jgi:iron complex outermembrane receptor protein
MTQSNQISARCRKHSKSLLRVARQVGSDWPRETLLVALLSSIGTTALAQSAPPTPDTASDTAAKPAAASDKLDPVVVTAQRKSENLQKVPIAVTALTQGDIENRQINSVLDVATNVPNLVGAENVGLSTATGFFLRGVGQDESISTSDPAVGTYIDGVYVARQVANNAYLYDIERIEVLRGPQGTLYGRNTSGGAVSIITQKPSDEFIGNFRTSYGNYGRYDLRGSVSGPIADGLTGSFAAFTAQQKEGFQYDKTTGQRAWDQDAQGARGALRYRPSANLEVNFSAEYALEKPLPVGPVNAARPGFGGDYFTLSSGLPIQRQNVESTAYTLNIAYALADNLTFRSITGYRKLTQRFNNDLSDNPTPLYTLATDARFTQFSQEFNLGGKAFDNRFSWTAGAFFMDERNASVIGDNLSGLGIGLLRKNLDNDTKSSALYGQGTYKLTDELGLTLGGRFTRERRSVDVLENFVIPGIATIPLFSTADVAALGTPVTPTYTAFTPKAAVDYAITPDLLAYASYTRGFKSGGWNARALNAPEFVVVKPEKVKSYETGLKSEWLDRRLRLNATYFYADYTDFIVTAVSPITGGFVTVNAAEAAIQGVELEALAQVTSNLRLHASLGSMKGKYLKLDSSVSFPITNQVKRTPRLSVQTGFDYDMPITDNLLATLHANYSFTGRYFDGVNNTQYENVKARNLVDILVSIKNLDKNVTLFAGCKNCTNDHYFDSTLDFSALGFASQYPGQPRTFTVGLNYDFGAR